MAKIYQTRTTFLFIAAIVVTILVPSVVAHRDEGSFGGLAHHNKMIKKRLPILGRDGGGGFPAPILDPTDSGTSSSTTPLVSSTTTPVQSVSSSQPSVSH